VLELIPASLAAQITAEVSHPTIGIGAGSDCDGQIQVMHDVLGITATPLRHAKAFVDGRLALLNGIASYAAEVRQGTFPGKEHAS